MEMIGRWIRNYWKYWHLSFKKKYMLSFCFRKFKNKPELNFCTKAFLVAMFSVWGFFAEIFLYFVNSLECIWKKNLRTFWKTVGTREDTVWEASCYKIKRNVIAGKGLRQNIVQWACIWKGLLKGFLSLRFWGGCFQLRLAYYRSYRGVREAINFGGCCRFLLKYFISNIME